MSEWVYVDLDGIPDRDAYLVRDLANAMANDASVGLEQRRLWDRLTRSLGSALLDRAQARANELHALKAHGLPSWSEAVERVADPNLEDPLVDDGAGGAS